MINNSLSVLAMYARLGIRYLTLTHSVNTEWADSSNDEPQFGGLTEFGKKIVKRLNHLGIMVDISHASDKTFWDTLETSEAPLVASHSSCRALSPHRRNMSDQMIAALAAKGGVIQITFVDQFLDNAPFQAWEKKEEGGEENLRGRECRESGSPPGPKRRTPQGRLGENPGSHRPRSGSSRSGPCRPGIGFRWGDHAAGNGRRQLPSQDHGRTPA